MSDHAILVFTISLLALVVSVSVSWVVLKFICLANPNFLKALYISSEKSTTNARLLGGLAISGAMISTIASLLFFLPEAFNAIDKKIITSALISIGLVTIYGYIDDKFEVRVRFKLGMQFLSVFSFAYTYVQNSNQSHPILAFAIFSFFGLALVNGTNLLDGLDTLMVKLGGVSSLGFLYLGISAHSTPTIFLSVAVVSSLAVFYFFNKEPAKVYMGEIGGSLIGLVFFIQSAFCYSAFKTQMSSINAIALICIASSFPVFELGISFLRRIWGKKSPFRGDKLHLHYVLKNRYQLTASNVSSRLGLSGFAVLAFGFLIAQNYNPIIAFSVVSVVVLQGYMMVCFEEWKSTYQSESSDNIFKLFEGKTINIIDSTKLGPLDISVTDSEKKDASDKKRSA